MRRPQTRSDYEPVEPILTTSEIIDGATRRVMNGIVIAGAVVALAIYARPGPSDYQGFASEKGVVRLNLESGSMIECVDGACTQILRPGQSLLRPKPKAAADPAPPAPAQRRLAPPEAPAPGAGVEAETKAPEPQPAAR